VCYEISDFETNALPTALTVRSRPNFLLTGNLSCDVSSHFRNIIRLSLLKTAINDFIINEAMTRQVIFHNSEY
jgi:hypothetical protein